MQKILSISCKYLGMSAEQVPDKEIVAKIGTAYEEVRAIARFRYRHAFYTQRQDFMLRNPAYSNYLGKAEGYLLCATTLGIGIDSRLKRLQVSDMSYAVVFDAVASAYLETEADAFEASLPYPVRGFRFCPGYGGTPLTDNREIATLLHADELGITFLDSGLMVPAKSMTGIVKIGSTARKSCDGCAARGECAFRQKGTTCYRRESEPAGGSALGIEAHL